MLRSLLRRASRAVALQAALIATLSGCTPEQPPDYRGLGLQTAVLSADDRAAVYRAALSASFPIDDPNLWVLADTLLLPRSAGLDGGSPIGADVLSAMRARGLVKGTCRLPVKETRTALICSAERAGYVVRFSEPFNLGRDSVQVHVAVQQYAIPYGPRAERLRFERAYHVVRRAGNWRAVREARMPKP